MPRHQKSGTVRFDLDISPETEARFAAIQKKLGFRTKIQTFEAMVHAVTARDIVNASAVARLENKLDLALQAFDIIG